MMDWQALATIGTAVGALAGSILAVRNSRAARRQNRELQFIQTAEKRAAEAEKRAAEADTVARKAERHAQSTELRAERSEWRLARLEQNEQLNEIEIERLGTAARRMAAWIHTVVAAAEEHRPAHELHALINGGPPESLPFRDR